MSGQRPLAARVVRTWSLLVLAAMAGLAPQARAGSPSAEPADPAKAILLDTEIQRHAPAEMIVRSTFQIHDAPQRRVTLYSQILFDAATFLKASNGRDFVKAWGDIFTPKASPAEYDECRLGLTFKELESAPNLPKGRRTVLWVSRHIWDKKQRKYIGNGWPVRSPLIVTTNAQGKITDATTFYTPGMRPLENEPYKKAEGNLCKVATKQLVPKPGIQVVHFKGMRERDKAHLILGGHQALLTSSDRGYFFGPIDTPEKARELVEIALPKSLIIKDKEQFDAIVARMKKIPRWDPSRWMSQGNPEWYGLTVTPEPGVGYHVKALVFWHFDYGAFGHRHLYQRHYRIATDGRMAVTEKIIILGPKPPYGTPPGWEPEFGWVKRPPVPGERLAGLVNPTIAYDKQNAAIQAALKEGHYETIAPRITVTHEKTKVPAPKRRR